MHDAWEWLNRKHFVGTAGWNFHHWELPGDLAITVEKGWVDVSINVGPFWFALEWFKNE